MKVRIRHNTPSPFEGEGGDGGGSMSGLSPPPWPSPFTGGEKKVVRSFGRFAVLLLATSFAFAEPPVETHGTTGHGSDNTLDLDLERLQAIGVKFEPAARRSLDKTIRTVGRVEFDERRLAHVNVKVEGWIDQLFVNTTGQPVKQGQVLLTLYSPELVATQEEYLLALRGARTLGESEFPEVARGARSTLEVTRRRLELWDIAESHIHDLEDRKSVV